MAKSKVVLPKEVSEAIERLLCWDIGLIKSNGLNSPDTDYGTLHRWIFNARISEDRIRTYFDALVNGYEVEQSPEDKLRDYVAKLNFDLYVRGDAHAEWLAGFRKDGVLDTLRILGITIEGINDKEAK